MLHTGVYDVIVTSDRDTIEAKQLHIIRMAVKRGYVVSVTWLLDVCKTIENDDYF